MQTICKITPKSEYSITTHNSILFFHSFSNHLYHYHNESDYLGSFKVPSTVSSFDLFYGDANDDYVMVLSRNNSIFCIKTSLQKPSLLSQEIKEVLAHTESTSIHCEDLSKSLYLFTGGWELLMYSISLTDNFPSLSLCRIIRLSGSVSASVRDSKSFSHNSFEESFCSKNRKLTRVLNFYEVFSQSMSNYYLQAHKKTQQTYTKKLLMIDDKLYNLLFRAHNNINNHKVLLACHPLGLVSWCCVASPCVRPLLHLEQMIVGVFVLDASEWGFNTAPKSLSGRFKSLGNDGGVEMREGSMETDEKDSTKVEEGIDEVCGRKRPGKQPLTNCKRFKGAPEDMSCLLFVGCHGGIVVLSGEARKPLHLQILSQVDSCDVLGGKLLFSTPSGIYCVDVAKYITDDMIRRDPSKLMKKDKGTDNHTRSSEGKPTLEEPIVVEASLLSNIKVKNFVINRSIHSKDQAASPAQWHIQAMMSDGRLVTTTLPRIITDTNTATQSASCLPKEADDLLLALQKSQQDVEEKSRRESIADAELDILSYSFKLLAATQMKHCDSSILPFNPSCPITTIDVSSIHPSSLLHKVTLTTHLPPLCNKLYTSSILLSITPHHFTRNFSSTFYTVSPLPVHDEQACRKGVINKPLNNNNNNKNNIYDNNNDRNTITNTHTNNDDNNTNTDKSNINNYNTHEIVTMVQLTEENFPLESDVYLSLKRNRPGNHSLSDDTEAAAGGNEDDNLISIPPSSNSFLIPVGTHSIKACSG